MVRVEQRGGVRWVTLDRPEALNAFTGRAYLELGRAVEEAEADPGCRVLVLTGTGRAFSVGADRSLLDASAPAADRELAAEAFGGLLDGLAACGIPVVAAVNGYAVGFGCTILLHCDLVLVASSARLRLPFTALGIVPEAGSSLLLPARARWSDAAWAMLSSEWIDADAAVAMGIAWRSVADEDLLAEAEQAAATISALDPDAVAATKRLLLHGRADLVSAARRREEAEMRRLTGR